MTHSNQALHHLYCNEYRLTKQTHNVRLGTW